MPGKVQEDSMLGKVRALKCGESLTVPMERMSYARSIVSTYSLEWSRKYTTRSDRKSRTLTIKRIA